MIKNIINVYILNRIEFSNYVDFSRFKFIIYKAFLNLQRRFNFYILSKGKFNYLLYFNYVIK